MISLQGDLVVESEVALAYVSVDCGDQADEAFGHFERLDTFGCGPTDRRQNFQRFDELGFRDFNNIRPE